MKSLKKLKTNVVKRKWEVVYLSPEGAMCYREVSAESEDTARLKLRGAGEIVAIRPAGKKAIEEVEG